MSDKWRDRPAPWACSRQHIMYELHCGNHVFLLHINNSISPYRLKLLNLIFPSSWHPWWRLLCVWNLSHLEIFVFFLFLFCFVFYFSFMRPLHLRNLPDSFLTYILTHSPFRTLSVQCMSESRAIVRRHCTYCRAALTVYRWFGCHGGRVLCFWRHEEVPDSVGLGESRLPCALRCYCFTGSEWLGWGCIEQCVAKAVWVLGADRVLFTLWRSRD